MCLFWCSRISSSRASHVPHFARIRFLTGPSYLGVGSRISGYSLIPHFEPTEPSPITQGMTATAKSPPFKGSGMKLGSAKKTKQAKLLDVLGGEVLATTGFGVEERTAPMTPMQAVTEPTIQKASGRGSVLRLRLSGMEIYTSFN